MAWFTAVIVFLTLIVTFALWLIASARPSLDFETTYLSHALGARGAAGGVLQVTWNMGEPPDPHVLALRIGNYGRRPIRADQFSQPLRIEFADAWLLDVIHTGSSTESLTPMVLRQEDENTGHTWVEIEPLLLNGGDWFEVQAFVNGPPAPFSLHGRVEGVRRFRDRGAVRLRRRRVLSVVVPTVWALVFVLVWAISAIAGDPLSWSSLGAWFLGSVVGLTIGRFEASRP